MPEPIREKRTVKRIARHLHIEGDLYYVLFLVGVQTGMPINRICNLVVNDVDFERKSIKGYEDNCLGESLTTQIRAYVCVNKLEPEDYLISLPGHRKEPLNRIRVYRALKKAGMASGYGHLCGETIRKTYGYFHYREHRDIVALQKFFNQRSAAITARFIGVAENEKTTERHIELGLKEYMYAIQND